MKYTVQPGDHISSIAEHFKFFDWKTIWEDGANAEIRNLRKDPDVLNPGDEIEIPEKKRKEEACATAKYHVFECKVSTLRLRMRFQDQDGKARESKPVEVEVENTVDKVMTDANGIATRSRIPRSSKSGRCRIEGEQIQLKVGYLNPVDTQSGQQARLMNLGYYRGSMDETDDMEFRSAVEEFQCDNSIKVTGVCDGATQAKLKELHGS